MQPVNPHTLKRSLELTEWDNSIEIFSNVLRDAQQQTQKKSVSILTPQDYAGGEIPSELINILFRLAAFPITYFEKGLLQHNDPSLIGRITQLQGAICFALKKFDDAIYFLKKSIEVNRDVTTLRQLGSVLYSLGGPLEALDCYEEAVQIDASAKDWCQIGLIWDDLGDPMEAIDYYDKGISVLEKTSPNDPNLAILYNNKGVAWKALGELKEAFKCFEKCFWIDLNLYGARSPKMVTVLNHLGDIHTCLGEVWKGIQFHEKALSILRKSYGNDHPYLIPFLEHLSRQLEKAGEIKKSVSYRKEILKIKN